MYGNVKTRVPDSRRLDRKDWIEMALDTLAKESVEAVLVVPLAKKLGVTKGSFYWHFKSREELLMAALDLWRERTTQRIIEYVDARSDNAEDRLRHVFKIAVESKYQMLGGQIEIAIRDWARQDSAARRVVARVDEDRLNYLTTQYMSIGFDEDEARTRGFMQTSFSTGQGINFAAAQQEGKSRISCPLFRDAHRKSGRGGISTTSSRKVGLSFFVFVLQARNPLCGRQDPVHSTDALAAAPHVAPGLGIGAAIRQVQFVLGSVRKGRRINADGFEAFPEEIGVDAGHGVCTHNIAGKAVDDHLLVPRSRRGFVAGDEERADVSQIPHQDSQPRG